MNDKLAKALTALESNYSDVVEIANSILRPTLTPINSLIDNINSNINSMSIELIRDYILKLQLKAYEISEYKEHAAFRAELATALQKEAYAVKFNSLEGSAAVKDKLALVETSQEVVTECLCNLVANLLKTKMDQLHRLVDALKSVLMSRMQEAKFMNVGTTAEVPPTTNGRVVLNESTGKPYPITNDLF